jgi:site-specific recombinase XerD
MRISEALALKRGHLNWRAKPAYAVVAGKGSKERYVFFSPVAVRALRQYFRERDRAPGAGQANPDQPLLAGHGNRNRGGHITATSAWLVVRRLGDRALQRLIDEDADAESVWRTLHPHDFRHAALTRLWEQSSDLRFVQEIAGHASSSTTAGYTHPSAQALGERYLQTLSVEDEEEG